LKGRTPHGQARDRPEPQTVLSLHNVPHFVHE